MTPLQKCRSARKLSLPALEKLLLNVPGGSKPTLSRLENKPVKNINKNLLNALVEIFSVQGLTEKHIHSPEQFPDFVVNDTTFSLKTPCPVVDKETAYFNEQQILLWFTRKWLENSNITGVKFAENLYELLAKDGLVKGVSNPDEYQKWLNTAYRRVLRILDESTALPLAWKHYWLACLPDDIAQRTLNHMTANIGYMLLPLPTNTHHKVEDSRAKIDEISHQFANVIKGSHPAMDGEYDERDCVHELQRLQDELLALMAACLREASVITANTGVTSKAENIWANSPLNKPY